MSRVLSKSVLVALSLLALSAAGCSATQTDDVYTADEQRADVGPIARDEVVFPLAVGTTVPDASGVAVPLRAGKAAVYVRFIDLIAVGTCDSDSGGEGEFYYDLGIDGRSVGKRSSGRYVSLAQDDSTQLQASRVFFVDADEPFNVRIDVSEEDDFLNGKDDHVGTDSESYTANGLVNGRAYRSVDIGSGDCGVTVEYSLERVQ
jgi:hypothetical protein